MLTRVLLVLVFLSGCCACGPTTKYEPIKIEFPINATAQRIANLQKAVNIHISRYRQFELPIPTTAIILTDTHYFTVGTDPSPIYIGGWFPPYVIKCWVGDNDEIPGLYHELNHRSRFLLNHEDDSWGRVNSKQLEVVKEILASR